MESKKKDASPEKRRQTAEQINLPFLGKLCSFLNYMAMLALVGNTVVRSIAIINSNKSEEGGDENAKKNLDPFYFLLTLYLIPFAFLMFVAEIQWRPVLKYVMFMKGQVGKGLFYVFVALLMFDTDYPMDVIASLLVTFVGIFNLILSCLVPSVEHLRFLKYDMSGQSESEAASASDYEQQQQPRSRYGLNKGQSGDSDSDHDEDKNLIGSGGNRYAQEEDKQFKMGRPSKLKKLD